MAVIALTPLVVLGDESLPAAWLAALAELRVERQFQVPARCSLRFVDPGYALLESGKAKLGTKVRVSDAADGTLVLVEAEVTSIEVDQRVGEQPELVIVAHDRSHRLGRATDVKSYLKMTYSEVVSELAKRCDLAPDVTPSELTVDYLMQADSDLGLLTELARRVGFDWWVEGERLCFKAPTDGASVELGLGDELLSFSVRASGHRPDQVTVAGWDREQQTLVSATATSPKEAVRSDSDLARLVDRPGGAFGTATVLTAGLAAHSQTEATQLSQAVLDQAGASSVSAQGVALGDGHLKLGVRARVTKAGPLSGTYPVTRVEHVVRPASGFLTRFHAGERRPSTLVDTLSGSRPATRPATLHPGLSVGQVTNINDPDKQGRVKVRYPGLSSQEETGWARIVGVGGGVNRGTVFIPEVNDEVLVGFEGGDPRQPVVIGGLYGDRAKIPPTTVSEGKVLERAITSRLGHAVRLVDGTEPAEQAINLVLAGGDSSIHLGKDKLAIKVPKGTPIEITAGGTSFVFQKDGSARLEAPMVSIKGNQSISLSAPQIELNGARRLSLQSDGTTLVKGMTMTLNSTSFLTMSGKPVSIN